MASFQILDSREEDELHKSRLLNVEEKPFKRITKRLLTPGSLLITPCKLLTPPPETVSSEAFSQDTERQEDLDNRRQFREDIGFDFAAFDYSISRIQFLLNSNERERERYRADKQRILETAQQVRDSTAQLRLQLEEAQKKLEQRKKFDKLAEKITNSVMLKSRDIREQDCKKLEQECEELEKESEQYAVTWRERREQFGRIVEEGMQLRRLIRDEKEEVERRQGLGGEAADEDGEVGEGSRGGQTPKHSSISGNATPRPDGPSQNADPGLKPRPLASGSLSRPSSRSNSRPASPATSERRRDGAETSEDSNMTDSVTKVEEGDAVADTPMAEGLDSQAEVETPQVTIEEPAEDRPEPVDEGETEDKMDTT